VCESYCCRAGLGEQAGAPVVLLCISRSSASSVWQNLGVHPTPSGKPAPGSNACAQILTQDAEMELLGSCGSAHLLPHVPFPGVLPFLVTAEVTLRA